MWGTVGFLVVWFVRLVMDKTPPSGKTVWFGNSCLKDLFPCLFYLAVDQEVSVGETLVKANDHGWRGVRDNGELYLSGRR